MEKPSPKAVRYANSYFGQTDPSPPPLTGGGSFLLARERANRYRFEGYFEWKGKASGPDYKSDTRKEVAVEYVTV